VTREFPQDQALELLEDAKEIASQPWRHGRRVRFVFEFEGEHWASWVDVHHSDGLSLYGPMHATKVRQVERVIKIWEDA